MYFSKKDEQTSGWFSRKKENHTIFCTSNQKVAKLLYLGLAMFDFLALITTFGIGMSLKSKLYKSHFTENGTKRPVEDMAIENNFPYQKYSDDLEELENQVSALLRDMEKVNRGVANVDEKSVAYSNKLKAVDGAVLRLNNKLGKLLGRPDVCKTTITNGVLTTKSGKEIYCENKWRVFQRNYYNDVNYDKSLLEYKEGFGEFDGDFWIGLVNIREATRGQKCKLKIYLWNKFYERSEVQYNIFYIDDERNKFAIHVSGYNGTADDGLLEGFSSLVINNMAFTTKDEDNDSRYRENCAVLNGNAGWWYNACAYSNLNMPNGQLKWGGQTWKSSQMMFQC